MPITGPTAPAQTYPSQQSASVSQTGSFAQREVSIAAAGEQFISLPSLESTVPQQQSIQTRDARQAQASRADEQSFLFAYTGPVAVEAQIEKLADSKTSAASLKNHIDRSHDQELVSEADHETLSTLADFNEILDKQLVHMADLADKLGKKPSTKKMSELNALYKANQHNMMVAQKYLAHIEANAPNRETKTIANAFQRRFVERHEAMGELMFSCSDSLPQQEPISRAERIDYRLLQAQGCLRAIEKMNLRPGVKLRVQRAAQAHHKELERYAKFAALEANPEEDKLSLDVFTEDFTLTKDSKKISPKVLDPLKAEWRKLGELGIDPNAKPIPLSHPKLSHPMLMELFIKSQLEDAGVAKKDMPNVGFLLKQGIIEEINNKEWPEVNKEVVFTRGKNQQHQYRATSTITPGGHLAKHFQAGYPSNGISSMDRMQYKHVPNMAVSKMTSEDGECTFSGIRHGILDPYTINEKNLKSLPVEQLEGMMKDLLLDTGIVAMPDGINPEDYAATLAQQVKAGTADIPDLADKLRTESSKMMAKELLTAAVVSDPKKLQAALNGETVDVTLNSVSLVTPDALRARFKAGSSGDEKTMLVRQANSLKALEASGETVALKVRDADGIQREIAVRPKVRTFNFGVNKGAVATTKSVLGPSTPLWGRAMGWEFAASMNNPELRDLLGNPETPALGGTVAAKVAELRGSDDATAVKRANLLEQAAAQVKQIWNQGAFRSGGREPYKMVSRLALISHLMGETTLYNCKSGKDRTGQLDAEVKYLASMGNVTGRIPRPEAPHTTGSQRRRTNFALNTGNHEMQQMTVGLKGYKLKGVPGLQQMLRADMIDIYRGGSAFVKT